MLIKATQKRYTMFLNYFNANITCVNLLYRTRHYYNHTLISEFHSPDKTYHIISHPGLVMRYIIKKSNLTQPQVSEKLLISHYQLKQILDMKNPIPVDILSAFDSLFKTKLVEIYGKGKKIYQ